MSFWFLAINKPLISFLVLIAITVLATVGRCDDSTPNRPTFIIFLVDDIGYGDIECIGSTRAKDFEVRVLDFALAFETSARLIR